MNFEAFMHDIAKQKSELITQFRDSPVILLIGYDTFFIITQAFFTSPIYKYGFITTSDAIGCIEQVIGMTIAVDPTVSKRCTLLVKPHIDAIYRAHAAEGRNTKQRSVDIEV